MFERVVGQETVKKQLESIIKEKKVSNAYLFTGPEGVGKKIIAEEFSKELLNMDIRNSQDYIFIDSKEGESSIKIEKIRNLIETMSIKPYGNYKIYVINDAEKMTIPAQNSLLKTLEEPASYGIIILITKNKQALLETIRSRCTEVKFSPLSDKSLREILSKKGFDKEIVNLAVNFSKGYGSVSIALKMCENPKLEKMRDLCEKFLEYTLIEKDKSEIMNTAEYFKEYSGEIDELMEIIRFYIRDGILLKEGANIDLIINSDRLEFLRKLSNYSTLSDFGKTLNLVDDVCMKLKSNCNFNTAIQSMAVSMM